MSDTSSSGSLPAIEILGKAAPNVPCESLRSLVSRQSRISAVSYLGSLVSPQLQSVVSSFLCPALRVTALQVSASPGRHEGESGRVCEAVRDTDTGIHRTCRVGCHRPRRRRSSAAKFYSSAHMQIRLLLADDSSHWSERCNFGFL